MLDSILLRNSNKFDMFKGISIEEQTSAKSRKNNTEPLLEQIDNLENELGYIKECDATRSKEIETLKKQNEKLTEELEIKTENESNLIFQLDDFKKKANVGLLDYYEQGLKNKEKTIGELENTIIENQQEHEITVRDQKNQIELHKKEASDRQYFEVRVDILTKQLDDFKSKEKEENKKEKFDQFKFEGDLNLERHKFNNLQEMAIKDKERCFEIELKLTQNEFDLTSKTNNITQLNCDIDLQKNNIEEMKLQNLELAKELEIEKQNAITKESEKNSAVGNQQKLNTLGFDFVEHINKLLKDDDISSTNKANNDLLSKLVETNDTIRKMGEDVAKSESEVNDRNNALRSENDKLRRELKRSKDTSDNLNTKLKEVQIELQKIEEINLQDIKEKQGSDQTRVAQELLKKVIDYEQKMNDQTYEKEKMLEENLWIERNCVENINLMYSAVYENYATRIEPQALTVEKKPLLVKKKSSGK